MPPYSYDKKDQDEIAEALNKTVEDNNKIESEDEYLERMYKEHQDTCDFITSELAEAYARGYADAKAVFMKNIEKLFEGEL